jgi:hypothetical protein
MKAKLELVEGDLPIIESDRYLVPTESLSAAKELFGELIARTARELLISQFQDMDLFVRLPAMADGTPYADHVHTDDPLAIDVCLWNGATFRVSFSDVVSSTDKMVSDMPGCQGICDDNKRRIAAALADIAKRLSADPRDL